MKNMQRLAELRQGRRLAELRAERTAGGDDPSLAVIADMIDILTKLESRMGKPKFKMLLEGASAAELGIQPSRVSPLAELKGNLVILMDAKAKKDFHLSYPKWWVPLGKPEKAALAARAIMQQARAKGILENSLKGGGKTADQHFANSADMRAAKG